MFQRCLDFLQRRLFQQYQLDRRGHCCLGFLGCRLNQRCLDFLLRQTCLGIQIQLGLLR
jgi:hypothetical protein